jgi:hypothetical protein
MTQPHLQRWADCHHFRVALDLDFIVPYVHSLTCAPSTDTHRARLHTQTHTVETLILRIGGKVGVVVLFLSLSSRGIPTQSRGARSPMRPVGWN